MTSLRSGLRPPGTAARGGATSGPAKPVPRLPRQSHVEQKR